MGEYELPPKLWEWFLNSPAGFPPSGIEPNFENPPSRSLQGNIDGALSLTLCSLAFFMRMYTRLFIMRRFSAEDYILLFAWCCSVALAGDGFYIVAHGLHHQWDLHMKDLIFHLYNFRIYAILHGICIAATKVAILMQYLRIFVPNEKGFMYWGCHTCIWLNVGLYSINIFVIIFSCRPPSMTYNPLVYINGTADICINIFAYLVAASAINLALDVVMLLLPQRAIWRLTISKKRRFGISTMFAMGIIACIASVMRLYYATQTLDWMDDRMGNLSELGIWMAPEVMCGMLIACLPVAPRFYQSIRDRSLTLIGSLSYGDTTRRASYMNSKDLDLNSKDRPNLNSKNRNHPDPYSTAIRVDTSIQIESSLSVEPSETREKPESVNNSSETREKAVSVNNSINKRDEVQDLSTVSGSWVDDANNQGSDSIRANIREETGESSKVGYGEVEVGDEVDDGSKK